MYVCPYRVMFNKVIKADWGFALYDCTLTTRNQLFCAGRIVTWERSSLKVYIKRAMQWREGRFYFLFCVIQFCHSNTAKTVFSLILHHKSVIKAWINLNEKLNSSPFYVLTLLYRHTISCQFSHDFQEKDNEKIIKNEFKIIIPTVFILTFSSRTTIFLHIETQKTYKYKQGFDSWCEMFQFFFFFSFFISKQK